MGETQSLTHNTPENIIWSFRQKELDSEAALLNTQMAETQSKCSEAYPVSQPNKGQRREELFPKQIILA